MGVIFWLSSLPGDEIKLPDFRFSDKAVHFLAYAALGFLIGGRLVLREWGSAPAWAAVRRGPDFRGAAAGIFYGASDEIHQMFVPLRESGLGDFAADALGVAAGAWLSAMAARWLAEKGRAQAAAPEASAG